MQKGTISILGTAFLFLGGILSCQSLKDPIPEDQLLDGMVEGLTPAEQTIFLEGDFAFNDEVFTKDNGLGPLFVATSCAGCHAGDGKGHPFSTLTRFGQSDSSGNHFLHLGGPQLQHRALPNFLPENLPEGAPFTRLTPPANTGLGYLEFVPDAEILTRADPSDLDNDGISGVPNWITLPYYSIRKSDAITQNGKYIGRFGKKASVYDLLQQTANAYNQDMGIASAFEPYDTYSGLQIDPEVSNQTIHNVVLYLQTLKAPIQRNPDNPNVVSGKNIFDRIGCEKCHRSQMTTGAAPIAALRFKTFAPYTDLLLHDMGATLNDGYTEGNALPGEWRTPALWGLGLSKDSQGGQYYLMHDGRAKSIEAAILLHGGEGSQSRQQFESLTAPEKQNLIIFLESL